ncbi:MAG: hypothetical protein JJ957_20210 [Pseudomonadales bacterium]|nr:hypothetical protein [Pseudomonadales bacterium]
MLFVFVDESGDSKFKDYLGICVVTINYTKYAKVKSEFQDILRNSNWDESIEFKGSCLFSASSGDRAVPIDERIDIAEKVVELTNSKANARINFHYLRTEAAPEDHSKEYLRLLPVLLDKAIPKAPKGAGKNIATIHLDQRDDQDIVELREQVVPVFQEKNYVMFEEPQMHVSNFNTVGILYADIIGYLAARIDTIANDAELFEQIPPEEWENNGKIKKLQSSVGLVSKVKNLQEYEVKL